MVLMVSLAQAETLEEALVVLFLKGSILWIPASFPVPTVGQRIGAIIAPFFPGLRSHSGTCRCSFAG